MPSAQLSDVQSLAYLSKRIEETGQESAIYDMIVGKTDYTFPSDYTTSDKIASVMLSSELLLETKAITYGPGGVVILEEPSNSEVYADVLEQISRMPNYGPDTDGFEQQKLDRYVTEVLDQLNIASPRL